MIFVLPVETYSREWLSKLELGLAILSAEPSAYVFIGDKKSCRVIESLVSDATLVDKGFDIRTDVPRYRMLKKKNWKIAVLGEENGVFFSSGEQLYRRIPTILVELADKIFLWGEAQKKMLVGKHKCIEEKNNRFVVSGHPRFQRNSLTRSFSKQLHRPSSKFRVLISTSFWAVNHIVSDEYCWRNYGNQFDNFDHVKVNHQAWFEDFKNLIVSLRDAQDFDNIEVTIRPHPEESCVPYETLVKGSKNIEVSKEGDINSALSKTNLVIHTDSTVAVEAVLSGVPTISLGRIIFSDAVCVLPQKISDQVLEDFRDAVWLVKARFHSFAKDLSVTKQLNLQVEDRAELSEWFYSDSDAASLIATTLSQIMRGNRRFEKKSKLLLRLKINLLIIILKLFDRSKRSRLGLEKFKSVDRTTSVDFLDPKARNLRVRFTRFSCFLEVA